MGEYTEFDGIAMQEGIGHLQRGQTQLNTELDDLKKAIGRGFERWTGEARTAYQAQQDAWDKSGQRMSNIIASIRATMIKIGQGYGDTEDKIKKNWSSR